MRAFVNSLPKSGTNLVAKLMRLAGVQESGRSIASSSIVGKHQTIKSIWRQDHFSGNNVPVGLEFPFSVGYRWLDNYLKIQDGQYLSGHAAFSEQLAYLLNKNSIKHVQVFRHPAAVLVSWAKFIVEDGNSWHPSHTLMRQMNLDDRCHFMLTGGLLKHESYFHSSFTEILRRIDGWLDSKALIVRYEDIVGWRGGGNDDAQRVAIEAVMRHIERKVDDYELDWFQDQLYGGTHTFRSGQINSWQTEISGNTRQLIQDKLGGVSYSHDLGYTFPAAIG